MLLSSDYYMQYEEKSFPSGLSNKWEQVRKKMRIYSKKNILKKSSVEIFIFVQCYENLFKLFWRSAFFTFTQKYWYSFSIVSLQIFNEDTANYFLNWIR